jgi:acetyl-CoA acetyltransferase
MRRKRVTVDEVLDGPLVAYPFRKEMCCVVTNGGGALVVTSAERAADLPSADRAVYLLGSGESSGPKLVSQMDDLTSEQWRRTYAAKARRRPRSDLNSSAGPAKLPVFLAGLQEER